MNRQQNRTGGGETSEASPLSLLVHAADAQNQRPSSKRPSNDNSSMGRPRSASGTIRREINEPSIEEQIMQRQIAAARAEAALQQQQGLLSHLPRGIEAELYQQAAQQQQQQQQAAAMAIASDLRTAMAAAQLRQAAQMQNQDFLLARAAQQQLGGFGASGLDQLQELELQRLEELERRHLLAQAASGHQPPHLSSQLAMRQIEMQEAQLRQEQLERLQQEALLEKVGRGAAESLGAVKSAPIEARPATGDQSDNKKDCFQKTPGSVVVPCRARGMPMDHNFKTAYFVIPAKVEHGEELICSYFACRNAGIKFRYCTYCKVPVAKRNFRKRHRHGLSEKAANENDEESQSGDELESQTQSSTSSKPDKHVSSVDKADDATTGTTQAAKAASTESENEASKPHSKPASEVSEKDKASKVSSSADDISSTEKKSETKDGPSDKIDEERKRRWATLLAKRPPTKDGSAMSGWLMEVLSVSDLDTPLSDKAHGDSSKSEATGAAPEAASAKPSTSGAADKTKETPATMPSQGVLVKKKRPLSMLMNKDEATEEKPAPSSSDPAENSGGGGFAEWKDRKKHKGLHKMGMSE